MGTLRSVPSDVAGSSRRAYVVSLHRGTLSFTYRHRRWRLPRHLPDTRSGSGARVRGRQLRAAGRYEQRCIRLRQPPDRCSGRPAPRESDLPSHGDPSLVRIRSHFLQGEVLPPMMDAYTHLDMSAQSPMAALEQWMDKAAIDRALVVETWGQDNRSCLDRIICSPSPQFRVAFCVRVKILPKMAHPAFRSGDREADE